MQAGTAGFEDIRCGSVNRRTGAGDIFDDLKIGFPRFGRGVAADVAALGIVEFDERVFGQDGLEPGGRGVAVAAGRD